MAKYEITAEMNLKKIIAELKEVTQVLNEFTDNLERIEEKYAEPQERSELMIKVYGYSDDNLVIEGAPYPADEIDCFDSEVKVRFSDGTLIKAWYGKNDKGIWGIEVLEKGTAKQTLTECFDEDAEMYSDVFEIDADYVSHSCHYING